MTIHTNALCLLFKQRKGNDKEVRTSVTRGEIYGKRVNESCRIKPRNYLTSVSTGCNEARTTILDCNVPLFSCSMNSTGLLTADAEHLGVNRMTRNL